MDLVQTAKQQANDLGMTYSEMYANAIEGYLSADITDDMEARILDIRDRLLEMADRLGGGSPASLLASSAKDHHQYRLSDFDMDEKKGQSFSFPDRLMSRVDAHIADHPENIKKNEVFHRALIQWLNERQEERLDRWSRETVEALDVVEDRLDALEESGLRLQDAQDVPSEDMREWDDPDTPSLADCAEEGRAFNWEELQAVSEYADTHGEEFALDESRVDRSLIGNKPDVSARLAYGLIKSSNYAGRLMPEEFVKSMLMECVANGTTGDEPSERQLFTRNDNYKSYLHRLKSYLYEYRNDYPDGIGVTTLYAVKPEAFLVNSYGRSSAVLANVEEVAQVHFNVDEVRGLHRRAAVRKELSYWNQIVEHDGWHNVGEGVKRHHEQLVEYLTEKYSYSELCEAADYLDIKPRHRLEWEQWDNIPTDSEIEAQNMEF